MVVPRKGIAMNVAQGIHAWTWWDVIDSVTGLRVATYAEKRNAGKERQRLEDELPKEAVCSVSETSN